MSQFVRAGGNGAAPGRSLWVWCPGCDDSHRITFGAVDAWSFDGNETAPTIEPSILVRSGSGGVNVCHSFLRAGVWDFLNDSTHSLAGQQVPVVPLPDWLNDDYVSG